MLGEISSRRFESEEVDHPIHLETSSHLRNIQSLAHQTEIHSTPSVTVEDSYKKLDDKTMQSSDSVPHSLDQWLYCVNPNDTAGPSIVPSRDENLDDMYEAHLHGLQSHVQ